MIEYDSQLKLQAYLDGELSVREARKVADWLAKNAEARSLLTELQYTNAALSGHESELGHPESREFFWSKVQRQIQREDKPQAEAAPVSIFAWLQRRLVPVSGLALLLFVLTITAVQYRGQPASEVGEIELASADMGAITFRSQSERMTMVWLYNRNDSGFTGVASIGNLEPR